MPNDEKKSKGEIDLNKHLMEWGNAILRAAVIILVLFFFAWPMRLMGSSMEPTMGDGEIVLMNRFAAMQGHYETGDIVMFHYYDADGDKTVVKRIIATEGDAIRILEDGVEEGIKLLQNSIDIKTSKRNNYIDKIKAIVLIQIKIVEIL